MKKIRKILMQIAAENHTTVEDVRSEISAAIEVGMKNPDPEIQKIWWTMSKTGETPAPEEVIIYLSNVIKSKIPDKKK